MRLSDLIIPPILLFIFGLVLMSVVYIAMDDIPDTDKEVYVIVDSINRVEGKIKEVYIGCQGSPRHVLKVYVEECGVARERWPNWDDGCYVREGVDYRIVQPIIRSGLYGYRRLFWTKTDLISGVSEATDRAVYIFYE